MQFPVSVKNIGVAARLSGLAVVATVFALAFAGVAQAESPYISQAPAGTLVRMALTGQGSDFASGVFGQAVKSQRHLMPSPETAVSHPGNLAQTLQIGAYNQVTQMQAGQGDSSFVGVVAGAYNNVGVLQAGNNLRSSLLLVNTLGLNVGVLQPSGSAPVNVLIARLPGGGLLIKR